MTKARLGWLARLTNRSREIYHGEEPVRSPALLFQAYIEFMKVMLGNIFIINAGSATALLAFLGGAKERTAAPSPAGAPAQAALSLVSNDGARWAIICFAIGALLAVFSAAALGWQENRNSDLREQRRTIEVGFGITGFFLLLASAIAFSAGCIFAVTR